MSRKEAIMNTALPLTLSANPDQTTAVACASRTLHVVLVDDELPFPAQSAKQQRTFSLAQRLAQRHRLTLICHGGSDRNADLRTQLQLSGLGIRTVVVPGAALFKTRALRKAMHRYAAAHPVDLWQCESVLCGKALQGMRGIRWLAMAHHIESRLQKNLLDRQTSAWPRWRAAGQLRRLLQIERSVFSQALTTVTFNRDDADLAQFAFGANNVDLLDANLDDEQMAARLEYIWQCCASVDLNGQQPAGQTAKTTRVAKDTQRSAAPLAALDGPVSGRFASPYSVAFPHCD
jgi:hypothetical protein